MGVAKVLYSTNCLDFIFEMLADRFLKDNSAVNKSWLMQAESEIQSVLRCR